MWQPRVLSAPGLSNVVEKVLSALGLGNVAYEKPVGTWAS